MNNNKTIIKKTAIFYLTTFFLFLSIFPVFARRPTPTYKRCHNNLHILIGAIEMYNMDNSKTIDNFYPGLEYEKVEKLLIDKKYLKEGLFWVTPDCSYGGFDLTGSGTVFCKIHGTTESDFDKPIVPEYDHLLETPYSSEFLYKQQKHQYEIERQSRLKNFTLEYLCNPFVLFPSLIVIVLSLIYIPKLFYEKK